MSMQAYRRILAFIELTPEGEQVARRAAALAQATGARLALATVVDTTGEETTLAPVLTPGQARAALAATLEHRLALLATRIGAQKAESLALAGPLGTMIEELLQRWQPELVLAAAHQTFGLNRRSQRGPSYDLLLVQLPPPATFTGRLVRALVAAF
ncbi:universal stress protein [Thiobacter aerophilum]|uniref:Universal stress protein n=1 Tax=Thiobacter aerophilum TaxID=3121275 RepID=A0ABV0EE41_9BURK